MLRSCLVALLAVCALAAPPPLAITHVTVIDATGHAPQHNSTVFLTDGHVVDIGPTAKVNVPNGVRVVDGTGKFLIPGLWDMHVHILWKGKPAQTLPLFLANGVVGLRDMGGSLDVLTVTRQQIAAGSLPPVHLVAAGPLIDSRISSPQNTVAVATPDEGRAMVARLKQSGVDFLKIGTYLPRSIFIAILQSAKQQGLSVVGHVPFSVTAAEAARAGQKSIEHLTGVLEGFTATPLKWEKRLAIDPFARASHAWELIADGTPRRERKLIRLFAKKKTYQTPTLTVVHPFTYESPDTFFNDPRAQYLPADLTEDMRGGGQFLYRFRSGDPSLENNKRMLFQRYLDVVGHMERSKVPLLAGTDTYFTVPGFGLHEELALLVQAGLTPMQAIQTATRNPGRFFGQEKSRGTIQKGKEADLVLLDADPLADIHNTQKISGVVLGGRFYDRAELDRLLADTLSAAHKH